MSSLAQAKTRGSPLIQMIFNKKFMIGNHIPGRCGIFIICAGIGT
jgi:hypothetical protein